MLIDAIDPQALRRILVIKFRHHGDVLLTSPVFRALRVHAPCAEIDALIYADSREMLADNPDILILHTIDRTVRRLPVWQKLATEYRLLRALRARRYDLIIHLTEHPRGAWLVRYLRPRWAVARRYPGRRGRWWRRSFTHLYDVPVRQRHTVETHLDALRRLGLTIDPDVRALRLFAGDTATARIKSLLHTHGLSPQSFIVIHPTSRWLFKCWPIDHMAALLSQLTARGLRIVMTSGPAAAERAMIAAIRARTSAPLLDLSGQLTLKELTALLQAARLFVGVDSAPMHMAAAVQTPVVALFGPSGDAEWAPWQVPSRILTDSIRCRPCGLAGCGDGHISDCLAAIGVDRVLAAITDLLAETAGRSCTLS